MVSFGYLLASLLFIFGLKMLGNPSKARTGNKLSSVAMLIAVVSILVERGMHYQWIISGIIIGSFIGLYVAKKIKMTSMPEMVALFNGLGGGASLLVGLVEFYKYSSIESYCGIIAAIFIGGVTFSGSIVAYLKLSEKFNKTISFKGLNLLNALIFIAILYLSYLPTINYLVSFALYSILILSLILGISIVMPIGGADMPVVISLLNSYSGMAACAAGFIIQNQVLIVSGALVGASGIILTVIMCKSMNRSLKNVLFGKIASNSSNTKNNGEVKSISAEDAYFVLEAASSVLIVPGYGMAVAQAQHVVKELADLLNDNGCSVQYAIHPVAGRMPGHMNVLLAEANVEYENLIEMEEANNFMHNIDVCIVIGANDVVNTSARDDENSSIYGMPIIEVDKAKNVFILKRTMKSGFAGVDNPVFFSANTKMLFGDAKASVQSIVSKFKE